jgi:hypothetical protein
MTLDPDMSPEERDSFLAYSARAEGTNLSPQTLLATDYLNHFNEIVMLLEMIPDMPDCFEDVQAWQPKTYQQHFLDSQFHDRALAVEAYDHVPRCYRQPFEEVIGQIDRLIAGAVGHIPGLLGQGDGAELRLFCSATSHQLQGLMDIASAIIHGSEKRFNQSDIDGFLGN